MKTPHKHAELIKKWADDTSIKIEYLRGDGRWTKITNPNWLNHTEYRIKPEVIRYRVAYFKRNDDKWLGFVHNKDSETHYMQSPYFVEFKTDWIEVEV